MFYAALSDMYSVKVGVLPPMVHHFQVQQNTVKHIYLFVRTHPLDFHPLCLKRHMEISEYL